MAAAAGSERSVAAMICSSPADGWPVFSVTRSSEISAAPSRDPFFQTEGRMKLETSYAAGVRLGYLVAPNVLSYVNAGYSGSEWSGTTQSTIAAGGGPGIYTTPSFDRNGWFIGGGVENNLDLFGISAPGWFMKTEYRSAFYDRITLPATFTPAAGGVRPAPQLPSSLGRRPSAPRWSIASTGVALRSPPPGTDLF